MNGSGPGLVDCGAMAIGGGCSLPERIAAGSRADFGGSAAAAGFGATAGGVGGVGAGADARAEGFGVSGALGSQFLLRSVSAASCSGVRCCTLLTNGTGALVTYSATASASAKPTNRPTIKPITKPPRCDLMLPPGRRAVSCRFLHRVAAHAVGRADTEHR